MMSNKYEHMKKSPFSTKLNAVCFLNWIHLKHSENTDIRYKYQIQNLSKVRNPEKQNYWSIFTRTYNHEKINPFLANVPILHPLKTRGYKMGTLARNGLMRKSKEIKQNWTELRNFG